MEAALPPELNIPLRWAFSDSLFPDQLEDVRLVFLPNDVERGEVARFAADAKVFSPSSGQDWSLTQFYFVDFSKSRIGVKKCNFNKRTKVCVGRL